MTIQQALQDVRAFDIAAAVVSLWTFKRRAGGGFSVKSIDFTEQLENELKDIVTAMIQSRTEIEDYTFVAQCNEASCLHVGADETSFVNLRDLVDQPAEEHRIAGDRDLKGIDGYLVRLRTDGGVLYCVRKVTDAWKTQKARLVVNVVFRANRLELVQDKSFTIAKTIDFVVLGNDVFILNKRAFESLLSYKIEYANSFAALQQDAVFAGCFTTMQPLIAHVGTNTMHLRRMAVIQQKAHYADPAYMTRLQQVNAQEGWNLQFDGNNRIVATPGTMKVIMQVLLDHRLHSKLSLGTFDVPSATTI
jgi:hypothetical protein